MGASFSVIRGGEITMYRKNIKSGEGRENEDDFVAHERVLVVVVERASYAKRSSDAVSIYERR